MSDQMLPTPTHEDPDPRAAGATIEPFPSLGALRAAHNTLLKAHRTQAGDEPFWQEVEHFLRCGRATGTLLDIEDDRWAAQSLLDYWAATSYSIGREIPDVVLDEFDPSLAPEIPDDHCPYVGLAAFRAGQRPFFFGREQLVESLVDQVAAERLLAVVGSSGSGKSSIVLAGLLPVLQAGAIPAQEGIPASDQWRYSRRMVPGSDPLANLGRAILPNQEGDAPDVALAAKFAFTADGCRREDDYLVNLINETGASPFVLVIDQFEELFTLCTDEALHHAFINNLLALIQAPGARHSVILTIRTDFESFVARLPDFQLRFEAAIARVTPLNAAELRAVIEQPAALIGLKFEAGVVDALVQDVLGEPTALPLLQFTLLKLWENRERNRITWSSYQELGGGRLALARSADRLYENLIPEEQMTARRILLRLVRPGQGLEITSNRVRRSVLYQTGEAHDRVDRVLKRLVDADLLRLSPGERAEDTQVEVAHEALVRNWPRLVGWLEDERGRIRERLRLTEAAEQWLKLDRDPSALLRGTLLDEAQRLPDLNILEQEFVKTSLSVREAAAAEREAAHQRELEQAQSLAAEQQERADSERQWAEYQTQAASKLRGRARLLALITMVALLLAGAALWFGIDANSARNDESNARETAEAAKEDAENQAATAEAAKEDAENQATRAAAASTETSLQAATASAAEQTAEAAQETAVADADLARTAEAVAIAEQTKVSHVGAALENIENDLTNLQTMVAPPVTAPATALTPSGTPPATPLATPPATSALVVSTRIAATDAPPLALTTELTAAVVAYANVAQLSEPFEIAVSKSISLATASTITYIITETVVVEVPVTITDTINNGTTNGDTINADSDNATATPGSVSLTNTVNSTATVNSMATALVTQTAIVTTVLPFLPDIRALVPNIEVNLYAQAGEDAEIIGTLHGPMSLPILQVHSYWVQVVVADEPAEGQGDDQSAPRSSDQIGWVQSWQLNYQGDPAALPVELRYLVIRANELPFLSGEVISLGDVTGYPLLESLTTEYTEVITVPVGTEVTLLSVANVTSADNVDATPTAWFFISMVDPGGQNRIWRGYLLAAVIAERKG